jgi:hypothetical protein
MNDLGDIFNYIGYIVLKYIFRQNVKLEKWPTTRKRFMVVGFITCIVVFVLFGWILKQSNT